MRVTITGTNPPGETFHGQGNVHVGIQLGREPAELVRADAVDPRWDVDIEVMYEETGRDFRGAAVQGKRGERFVYLTWGHVDTDGRFAMFRRAKLMLDRVGATVMDAAVAAGRLAALVDLTGPDGGPRCARVDPPAIVWSVPPA